MSWVLDARTDDDDMALEEPPRPTIISHQLVMERERTTKTTLPSTSLCQMVSETSTIGCCEMMRVLE